MPYTALGKPLRERRDGVRIPSDGAPNMAKKHELRQALSKAADELESMAGKSEADGFAGRL
jgi:hypothetical protein